LIFPSGEMRKEDARTLLQLALELRLRVRLQLHKISPQEFPLTSFSFNDKQTGERETVRIDV
jgi:ATP-dependent Lon protease